MSGLAENILPDMPTFRSHAAKRDRAYVPSYDWGADTLGERHDRIADATWDVPGWLAREDAMKLYELAYFASRPILEIGTYCGRSAVTMGFGQADAGRDAPIVSLDVDAGALMLAQRTLRTHGVDGRIVLVCDTAAGFHRAFPSFRPGLVFVDGDHSAAAVHADLNVLAACAEPGMLVLLHDYAPADVPDTAGFPVSAEPIEVAEAAATSWLADHAQFAGTFGWSALYVVRSTPRAARDASG